MSARSLRDLLEQEIQELYSAETQIIEALPRMIERVSDDALRQALQEHLQITQDQKRRLETMAPELDIELDIVTCRGMTAILSEATETIGRARNESIGDTAILASVQKVEHYEIASYGSAAAHARLLGEEDIAVLLERTLTEEREADRVLTGIAEHRLTEVVAGG